MSYLCKKLKTTKTTENISVVLFSVHIPEKNNKQLQGVRYDYFLSKPFDISQLTSIVDELTSEN